MSALVLILAAGILLTACDPVSTDSPISEVLATRSTGQPRLHQSDSPKPTPTVTRARQSPTTRPTVPLRPVVSTVSYSPTPHPGNSDWVRRRLDAVTELYALTEEGAALVHSLDVRQMRGEPGFFGSYGFHSWAGVGEARPVPVIHELSHSYWGAFPIEGHPELSWKIPVEGGLPPALERYHADILLFMSQPPDEFELLRQRLRNLPDLHSENLEPLIHNLEADMVYNTGGDLALVPPVLRKYWNRALAQGPFGSWGQAASWFRSLPEPGRRLAGQYLGFEHLDLREYGPAPATGESAKVGEANRNIVASEEKQRLYDLSDQFDLLVGGPQPEENFSFWRAYLRDKVRLHDRHPDYLASLDLPRAKQLAAALDTVSDLGTLPPREQAERLRNHLAESPFLVNFLPVIDNRALVDLFSNPPPLPQGATLQATASFVDRLSRFEGVVSGVLTGGRVSPREGALELRRFLEQTGYGTEEDLRLFFELMRERDHTTANRILFASDPDVFHRLLEQVPAQVRFLLSPDQLLVKLDINTASNFEEMALGVRMLVDETSGNYIIDEPFIHAMYSVIAARSDAQTSEMLGVLGHGRFPLHGFIRRQPKAAARVLEADLGLALDLVGNSDPVTSPPARIVHALVQARPELAARLITAMDSRGEQTLVSASLGFIAYDAQLSDMTTGREKSLTQDARFLLALLRSNGEDWFAGKLGRALDYFTGDASGRPANFALQFRSTLLAAAEEMDDPAARDSIRDIVARTYLEFAAKR